MVGPGPDPHRRQLASQALVGGPCLSWGRWASPFSVPALSLLPLTLTWPHRCFFFNIYYLAQLGLSGAQGVFVDSREVFLAAGWTFLVAARGNFSWGFQDLVPCPGIKPWPPAWGAQRLIG